MTNKPWSREELILALDVYFSIPFAKFTAQTPQINELSEILRRMSLKAGEKISEDFRSPNGVAMKLLNFYSIKNPGKGLAHASKADRKIWKEFSMRQQELSVVAQKIRTQISDSDEVNPHFFNEIIGEIMAPEGRLLVRTHYERERNPALVRRKKEVVFAKKGHLACEACGFDFEKIYGERGQGFIECHHTKPLHTLKSGSNTRLDDLVLLCANCHRMVHVTSPWLTMPELVETLRGASSNK